MTETLSSIFQRTRGTPIEVAEGLVHPIFQKKIRAGRSRFLARRLKSSKQLVSGLRLKVVKGELEVNSQRYSEIILWADTSPESFFYGGVQNSLRTKGLECMACERHRAGLGWERRNFNK